MLSFILLYSVMMALFVYDVSVRQERFFLQQSKLHAEELAQTIANISKRWIITDDLVSLEELLHNQSTHHDIEYALIMDLNGKILAHTNSTLAGQRIKDEFDLDLLRIHSNEKVFAESNDLVIAGIPIIANNQLIGWTKIALNQDADRHNINQVKLYGIYYTFLAIIFGSAIVFISSFSLTRGLKKLMELSEAIRNGNHQNRINLTRNDELGQLANNFNLMLDTLAARNNILDETRNRLNINQRRLELALEGGNYGLWDYDIDKNTIFYSSRWKEMIGFDEPAIGDSLDEWMKRVHPDDLANLQYAWQFHMEGNSDLFDATYRIQHKDNSYRWQIARGIVERTPAGDAIRFTGTTSDISDIKLSEQRNFEESQRFKTTLSSIGDAVITTDGHGNIHFINPTAEKLLGYSSAEITGKPFSEVIVFINEISGDPMPNPIDKCILQNEVVIINQHVATHNQIGEKLFIEATAAPIRNQNKQLIGAVIVIHDISLAHELTRHMSWQATHDSLTGLVNRREFERLLNQAIADSTQQDNEHALLYLDLDQFKLVNDTCGHTAGDVLLKQISFLLKEEIDTQDILSRLGGDEFGVLVYNKSIEQCVEMADRLRTLVRDYRFAWDNMTFDIGVSIGIVQINTDSGNLTRILSAADMACYAAKDSGRNRYHVYERSDKELMRKHGEMHWASRITEALTNDMFILYCQAIEPITPKENVQHIEILVRMIDKDGSHIPPGAFIPAAERYNFMTKLDRWVYENTLVQLNNFYQKNPNRAVLASINLSGQTLGDEKFHIFALERLQQYNIPPQQICFEITETSAIQNLSKAVYFIRELKKAGCLFSLDDFGSGLSSFGYLKNLPVDFLKIDGSFVKDIVEDPIDRSMVKAINEIGHTLQLQTIAEFVENQEILALLADIGVDYAQGYGLEKPMPLQDKLHSLLE